MAAYALPGSEELGRNIADVFAGGCDCVLLENHGVVVGGESLAQAFQRFETLEFAAKTIIKAGQLGPVRYLTPQQIQLGQLPAGRDGGVRRPAPRRRPRRRPADSSATSSSAATASACSPAPRAVSPPGWRRGEDEFVITSYGIDRGSVTPEDLTLVRGGRRQAGQRPSRAAAIHRAIYRRHPTVRAVANATPVNATAFCVTAEPLDARTIPESYLFLRQVAVAPFAEAGATRRPWPSMVGPDRPVLLLENNGALVVGDSVLDAFDRLEVLESTAEALINSRPVGAVHPMDEASIQRLIDAFLTKG